MDAIRRFFHGRYGIDGLTLVLLLFAVFLINAKYIWILGVCCLAVAIFRILSKNIGRRRLELQKFNEVTGALRRLSHPAVILAAKGLTSVYRKYSSYKYRMQQGKQCVFVKCPKCRNNLRLPRYKGKLSVTCPVCRGEFIKKT